MERRLRGTLPFCVVMVRNEGRAKRESADEEAKIKRSLQSSNTTRPFLREQLRTVMFLGLIFLYHFLNITPPPPGFSMLLNHSITERHLSIFKSSFVTG